MDNKEWEVSSAQIRRAHGYSTPADQRRLNKTAHEAEDLALDILKLSRDTLLINLRFLESAFLRFIPANETATSEMATDGHFLYYNSAHVCRLFKEGREAVARNYLHIVLHCLFRHLFVGSSVNPDFWDLASDIAVENVINGLGLKCLNCAREDRQAWLIRKLKDDLPHLSAERVYRWFMDQNFPIVECSRLRADFYADDHKIWHNPPKLSSGSGKGDTRDSGEDRGQNNLTSSDIDDSGDNGSVTPEMDSGRDSLNSRGNDVRDKKDDSGRESGAGSGENDKKDKPALSPHETEEMWEEISRRVEVDLDTSSNTWGNAGGEMLQTLSEINREKYDYAKFLRRFSVLGENMQLNDEEFDYIFYTYGLKLYKNMPLIEPLEYKEIKKVREFVIAIDTSESVAGETVQNFIEKTWNILKQSENFFRKVNVHIIQCSAKVTEDAKITSQEEFDSYMKRMTLRGFGGTDFRPVFIYVDKLIKEHEFYNLKGIIYFTDGYGTYPSMPPEYETAFIFMDKGREPPEVPAWAMRLMFTEDELKAF